MQEATNQSQAAKGNSGFAKTALTLGEGNATGIMASFKEVALRKASAFTPTNVSSDPYDVKA